MKKVRLFLIYGIIGLLCIAALAGYLIDRSKNSGSAEVIKPSNTPVAVAATESATPSGEEVAQAANTAAPATPGAVANTGEPLVGIARGTDYAETTRKAVENAGGLGGIISEGDTVLIKPNICGFATPDSPQITDYRVVAEIVEIARECGAEKIIIAEGPISGTAFSGMDKGNGYQNIEGVEFVEINNLGKEDCYEVKAENGCTGKSFYIPKVYMDADVVIGVPKLKTHFQPDAVVSLCLKNMYGVPPGKIYGVGYKNGLHMMGLKESIVDLNLIRKPDFQIVDGIIGGEGYGPLNNTPVNSNVIFAGTDPVAVDTVCLTFMGFTVDEIPHVKLAAESGVGIADLDKIRLVGANLEEIKMSFKPALSR